MILVFGKSGQVATELRRVLPDATFLGRDAADLMNPDACNRAVKHHRPEIVINTAAWTNVDGAEAHAHEATVVNAAAPAAMAAGCAELGIPFVHMSTDYVFNGHGGTPMREADSPDPQNIYGKSKLDGEALVQQSGATFAILRTSWVFSAHGSNFVRSILRLAVERDTLRIVADQHGGPTPAKDIAQALVTIADDLKQGAKGGIYHFAGAPDTTWADFATAIVAQAGAQCDIEHIASHQYPTTAVRPKNSKLDCSKITDAFVLSRPDWRSGLKDVLDELGSGS